MKNPADYLHRAQQQKYAIGAFNVAGIETFKAITQAAKKLGAPIILEASDGEVSYIGYSQIVALTRIYEMELGIPIILNLDHGKDFESCKKAIEAGFDYIHIDASQLPYEENVQVTQAVVELAHKHNIPVEGEMDHIQGSSEDHRTESAKQLQNPKLYTDPQKAKDYVARTGIDVFASFVGNLHGEFADKERINIPLLQTIKSLLPNTYLSLHGGSGIEDSDVRQAIQHGIVKVNVNSEMRIAYKMTLQETLNQSNDVAIYKLTPPAIDAVQKVVEYKIKLFGSQGKAIN
jgi:fructose-bisphosphate aldolase, class II